MSNDIKQCHAALSSALGRLEPVLQRALAAATQSEAHRGGCQLRGHGCVTCGAVRLLAEKELQDAERRFAEVEAWRVHTEQVMLAWARSVADVHYDANAHSRGVSALPSP